MIPYINGNTAMNLPNEGTHEPKILIIDDEEKIRNIYRRLLALEHYQILEAKDWEAATKLLANQPDIQIVLLDINMPVVDGSALYEVIRRYYPHLKILVTSSYPLEDQKRLIVKADDYYDKSHGNEILLAKIKHLLSQH